MGLGHRHQAMWDAAERGRNFVIGRQNLVPTSLPVPAESSDKTPAPCG
jgi:hypothetical protein